MVPSARIAIAHGQMNDGELETVMLTFSNAEADIFGVYDHRRIGVGYSPRQHHRD